MSDVYRFTFYDPAKPHEERRHLCMAHGTASVVSFLLLDVVGDKPEVQRSVRIETPLVADGCSVDTTAFCGECEP